MTNTIRESVVNLSCKFGAANFQYKDQKWMDTFIAV